MATNGNQQPLKDEVGWYFVEQYYTTLSKSPEKLHLFYSKRSQFVYGLEAEVANVSVGRTQIQERIKELDFQDCKVRISNVDSQASFDNIVIQVIGETSNKAGEPKKFVQTFVLAQQPSGYFVLNDMLRYINEEGDEEAAEAEPQADAAPSEPQPSAEEEENAAEEEILGTNDSAREQVVAPLDPEIVDKKLEEVSTDKVTPAESTVDTPAESALEAQDAPAGKAEAAAEPVPDPHTAERELAEEDAKKAEAPKDPSSTPVVTRAAAPAASEPEKPKEPPKPMTWASRAAAAAGPPRPVVPLPKTATPPAATQSRAAAPSPAPAAAPPTQSPESGVAAARSGKESGNEWQTAGSDSKRQSRPMSISGPPQVEKEGTLAYIRNVTDKIQADDLRASLSKYGELAYFDINRPKNCAFVEFSTPAGYQAAAAANPHIVNGEEINVEPRRPKANAYGGSNYAANRAGMGGTTRGRGGFGGDRGGRDPSGSGAQRAGHSGLNRPARGGPTAARGGRGAAQAGNA